MRFDDETIEAFLEIKWWDWDHDKIKRNAKLLSQPLTKEIIQELKKSK